MKICPAHHVLFAGIFTLIGITSLNAQSAHWVFFTDKEQGEFDPLSYFDSKAIERRIKNGIPLNHFTDWPVNPKYIHIVQSIADSISYSTRWFNAISIYCNEVQLNKITALPFVYKTQPIYLNSDIANTNFNATLGAEQLNLLHRQTQRLGLKDFEDNGINGKGIRVAIFDAGFPSVDKNPVFEHIRVNNRIIDTYDFVGKRKRVFAFSDHGTQVLSCIAGIFEGKKIGLATNAEFLLARTEISNIEPYAEEQYWLAAAEWADKNGAHIINSSLAYTYHRYFKKDMDGQSSLVAAAANMAARKGILVINAAGNDGDNRWKIIATPSDADSVLTVGGINPQTDYHIDFSSYGPTADKRVKPNVCAYAYTITSGKKGMKAAYGTSFATPLITGFAACAMQTMPDLKTMDLFTEIERSSDLFPYFDYAHGYGVPTAGYFTLKRNIPMEPTFTFVKEQNLIKVIISDFENESSDYSNLNYSIKATTPTKNQYLFYHVENNRHYLDKYAVLSVDKKDVLTLNLEQLPNAKQVRVHYKGYTEVIQLDESN